MAQAFASAGEVESLGAASVDAQLDANPWLQFLIETYPTGINAISARNLYVCFREWCDAEGRKCMSNTKFGRKLRRVEGYRQTLHKRSTKHCTVYDIKPLKDVDWADFFGIKRGGGASNPPPVERSEANPPPSEPSYCSGSEPKVEGMDSSGQPQFNGPEDVVSVFVEKGGGNNPPHPPHSPPGTCTARVQAAMNTGCRKEEEILQWCAERDLSLSRTECRRVLKRIGQEACVSELAC